MDHNPVIRFRGGLGMLNYRSLTEEPSGRRLSRPSPSPVLEQDVDNVLFGIESVDGIDGHSRFVDA